MGALTVTVTGGALADETTGGALHLTSALLFFSTEVVGGDTIVELVTTEYKLV